MHDQNLDEIDHVDVLIGLLTSSFILFSVSDGCAAPWIHPRKNVVCYFEGKRSIASMNVCLCTHLIYTDIGLNSNGQLDISNGKKKIRLSSTHISYLDDAVFWYATLESNILLLLLCYRHMHLIHLSSSVRSSIVSFGIFASMRHLYSDLYAYAPKAPYGRVVLLI